MVEKRWHQIEELFHAALDIPSHQRAAFLEEACAGDSALKEKVQALIAADEQVNESDFLSSPLLQFPHIGQRVSHYEVIEKLGSGGMGEVYLALDTMLDRRVALKILQEDFVGSRERMRRFLVEAKAASAVSHPNVAHIYEIGETDGFHFIAMEYVEGETLSQKLKTGPYPPAQLVDVGIQITAALAEAHGKGIIHRDLKPGNIMITPGNQVKLLDFGIAKVTGSQPEKGGDSATTPTQTEAGKVMGTAPYMSPEQIRGEPIDARSDLFSFGCVLYEMLTGSQAFFRNSGADTVAAILKEDPIRTTTFGKDVPRRVVDIISRCLKKNPEERPASAHYVVSELKSILADSQSFRYPYRAHPPAIDRRLIVGIFSLMAVIVFIVLAINFERFKDRFWNASSGQEIRSIAVLPLKNLSGDPKQEYFADAMTDELITNIARIGSLRVISRTSVMGYKGVQKPLREIAKELNADAILEGSVLLVKDRIRITAQLIDGRSDQHLWAQAYDRNLEDVLALQNEVASSIAEQVQVKLAPAEVAQFAKAPKVNPQAYQAYLRGLNYAGGQISEENIRLAVEMFERSVELDPNFALAYTELSRAQGFLYFVVDHTRERLAKSKSALDRAFELQPGLAEGHIALGYYYYRGLRDYDRALQELRIAQKTLPNNKAILAGEGTIYRRQGKFEEALAVEQKVLAIDPRDALSAYDLGTTYNLMRKYVEAQNYFELCISLAPDEENGYLQSAGNLIQWKGDTKGARETLNRSPIQKSSPMVDTRFWVEFLDRKYQAALDVISSPYAFPRDKPVDTGMVYTILNKRELARASFNTARDLLEKELQEKPDDYNLHRFLGIVFAGLGRKEDAIREGKRAVELLPVSKDAVWGCEPLESLAFIYVLLGEQDAAVDQIEHLLSIPSEFSIPTLRIDPRWDPLRNNPRFQKLTQTGTSKS